MSETSAKILDRIRKLLATAKDQEGLPEGELAAKMARDLMLEHAVEEVDLGETPEEVTRAEVETGKSTWQRLVADAVATHCSCRFLFAPGYPKGWIWGRPGDIEIARYLLEVITRQIEQATERYRVARQARFHLLLGGVGQIDPGHMKEILNAFRCSAAAGVIIKLEQIRRTQETTHKKGTALMVLRQDKTDEAIKRAMGKKPREVKPERTEANADGFRAGLAITLNPAIKAPADPPRRQQTVQESFLGFLLGADVTIDEQR